MTMHNFTQLQVEQGFCKNVSTPRSAEEAYAVFNLWIDAELVRKGKFPGIAKTNKEEQEEPKEIVDTTDDLKPEEIETLEQAHSVYFSKFNKEVANNKKNDLNWIKDKIFN